MGTFLAAATGAGGGCYWHLVGSGQGFCSTPCSAQGIPTIESVPGQDTDSAEVEKPSFRITYKVMPRMFHFPAKSLRNCDKDTGTEDQNIYVL